MLIVSFSSLPARVSCGYLCKLPISFSSNLYPNRLSTVSLALFPILLHLRILFYQETHFALQIFFSLNQTEIRYRINFDFLLQVMNLQFLNFAIYSQILFFYDLTSNILLQVIVPRILNLLHQFNYFVVF